MESIKHFITKKLMLIFVAASIITLTTGCSRASNNQSQIPSTTQGKVSPTPSPSAADAPKQDQDLTKKLTSEKMVQSGNVYLAGNDAVALIMIKKGTDVKTANDLAAKYAKTLKVKYGNKKVNAHAFIEGQEVAHITL